MNERDIFLSALEISDPQARKSHVVELCGNDNELLDRVEALLTSHEGQSQFLQTPAIEQMGGDPQEHAARTMQMSNDSTEDENEEQVASQPEDTMVQSQEDDDEIALGYLEPSERSDSLGRLSHYEILEVIGQGAFGTVLKAFDEKLHRVVAIKVLAADIASTSPARKRFLREARSSAAIRHENVVSIYAVEDEPIPYLVMEYIPGHTLQQHLKQTGPLDLIDVLKLGRQIAYGLAAAHAEQLIHRDVKPGNILLEEGIEERVKITDFGLARAADDASMTQSGVIAGTPLYMAPEQAQGQKLDQRADLFSLGSVLYQMISGRPPFRGPSTLAVLKRVVEDTPRPLTEIIPEVPGWLCQIISRLHAKNPDDRFESTKEVGDLLQYCLSECEQGRTPQVDVVQDKTVRMAGVSGSTLRSAPMHPAMKLVAGVILLFVGFGFTEATGVTRLSQTVVRLVTGSGTLVIETDDPNVTIAIDGEQVTITGAGVEQLTLRPGEHTVAALKDGQPVKQELVTITRNGEVRLQMSLEPKGASSTSVASSSTKYVDKPSVHIQWPADAPPLASAPFDLEQAKQHQHAWAEYLGLPVEKAIVLGRDKHGLEVKLEMVLIPPGEFLMGSSDEEIVKLREQAEASGLSSYDMKWIDLEGPQRLVKITRPFYLSRNEFTTAQFRRFADDSQYLTEVEASGLGAVTAKDGKFARNPERNWKWAARYPQAPASPVINVTWNDAVQCCQWLSQLDQELTFTLPSEAQCEFACRAGTTTAWYSGNDETAAADYGWLTGPPWWSREVGQKLPNAFGLFDMHGNVWEWCRDSFHNYRDAEGTDPVSSESGEQRMMRGGNCFNGFSNDWNACSRSRSAVRLERRPDQCFMDRGFRVMATISDERLKGKSTSESKPNE